MTGGFNECRIVIPKKLVMPEINLKEQNERQDEVYKQ